TGELQIQVRDVPKAVSSPDSISRTQNALLADSRVTQDGQGARTAQLLFRIPSDRFQPTLAARKTLGEVKRELVNTQDVTKEYADLETRLAVKEQTVTRLRALLDVRAGKLSDVLEVERELTRAVTELEQLKG